jgi:hypothetical protein
MKRIEIHFRNIRIMAPAILLLLAGCASQPVLLCGGRIHNASGRELRNIKIVHQPTGQMVMNNLLPAGSDVDLAFADLKLKATSATIEWYDAAPGPRQATLALPNHGGSGGPQRLVYDINGAGQVQARLIPCH